MGKEIVTLTLENPAHGGVCVAHADGRTFFVRGGIPGEVVRATVTLEQKRITWAEVIAVDQASPFRTRSEPIVGADLSHLTPAGAREWKTRVLLDQLRRAGSKALSAMVADVAPALEVLPPPGDAAEEQLLTGRRTRARFGVDSDGHLTMNQYRSHEPVVLDSYPFLDARFTPVFQTQQWRERLKGQEEVTLVAPTGSGPLVVTDSKCWDLEGLTAPPLTTWSVFGRSFTTRALGFWQLHPEAPATLVKEVLTQGQFGPGDHVMELYSGAGLFTRFVAGEIPGGRIVALEGNEAAVADAEANCREFADRVDLYVGAVDPQAVADLDLELDNTVRAIILDPPRAGAGKGVIAAAAQTGASQITLVSCDPAAGARDMENLRVEGFSLASISAFDLFPHTHHFETVSTWRR